MTGASVERLVPARKRGLHLEHRKRYVRQPRNRPMGAGLELRAVRKNGTEFPVEISLSPWKPNSLPGGVICAIRDITAWQRMRRRSELIIAAAEKERKLLSLELHDDVLQCLVSLKVRVKLMEDEADAGCRARAREGVFPRALKQICNYKVVPARRPSKGGVAARMPVGFCPRAAKVAGPRGPFVGEPAWSGQRCVFKAPCRLP